MRDGGGQTTANIKGTKVGFTCAVVSAAGGAAPLLQIIRKGVADAAHSPVVTKSLDGALRCFFANGSTLSQRKAANPNHVSLALGKSAAPIEANTRVVAVRALDSAMDGGGRKPFGASCRALAADTRVAHT